jgi:Uma2 family endonuclease
MKRLSNRLRPFDDPDDPDEPGGWVVLTEPELWLGETDPTSLVLVPDLAGWRAARLPALPDTVGVAVVPDWVCEIASPSTRRRDRLQKMDLYAEAGVGHLWIVDPDDRFVEVWRLEHGRWTRVQRFCDDDVMRAEPFDGVEIRLGSWWANA